MESKTWSMIIGLILVLGGVLVLFDPFEGTMAAELLAAWAFVIGGVLKLIAVFTSHGWKDRLASGIFGIVFLWFGMNLLIAPFEGIEVLTLLFGLSFLISGAIKLVYALLNFRNGHFVLTLLASVVSLGIGFLVLANAAGLSPILFGILLGVELIASGIGILSFLPEEEYETA